MKKYILLLSLFLLWSCFWIGEDDQNAGLSLKQTETFSMSVPWVWREVSPSDIPNPRTGKLVFAYSSPTERQWYFNNLVVLEAANSLWESSLSLMQNTKVWLEASLDAFYIIEEENISFADESQWLLLIYDAKYNVSTPKLTYLQTARACGDTNYFMTISLAEKLENYDRYETLLSTFSCKN